MQSNLPKRVLELTNKFMDKFDTLLKARVEAWRVYNRELEVEALRPKFNKPTII